MDIKKIGEGTQTTYQSISSIINDYTSGLINLDAIYQRDVVWIPDKMAKFIESCLIGIIPNPIILSQNEEGEFICIDGKQRITSIIRFFNNKFPYEHTTVNKNGEPIVINYYASEIPKKVKASDDNRVLDKKVLASLKSTNIPVYCYKNLDYTDQVNIFHRLQNGQALSAGQIVISNSINEEVTTKYKQFFSKSVVKTKLSNLKLCNTDRKYDEQYKLGLELMFIIGKTSKQYKKPDKKDIDKLYSNLDLKTLEKKLEIIEKLINFLNVKTFINKMKVKNGNKYVYSNIGFKYAFLHFLLNTKYNEEPIYQNLTENNFEMVKTVSFAVYDKINSDSFILDKKKKNELAILFDRELEKYEEAESDSDEESDQSSDSDSDSESDDNSDDTKVTKVTKITKVTKKSVKTE